MTAWPDGEHLVDTTLVCNSLACQREFAATALVGGTHEAWLAWMQALLCPRCGAAAWNGRGRRD